MKEYYHGRQYPGLILGRTSGLELRWKNFFQMASRCIGSVAQKLQGENVLSLDTLELMDFQGVAHRHFDAT